MHAYPNGRGILCADENGTNDEANDEIEDDEAEGKKMGQEGRREVSTLAMMFWKRIFFGHALASWLGLLVDKTVFPLYTLNTVLMVW